MAALQRRTLDTTEAKREMAADLDAEYLEAYASGKKTMSRGEHVSIKGSKRMFKDPPNGGN